MFSCLYSPVAHWTPLRWLFFHSFFRQFVDLLFLEVSYFIFFLWWCHVSLILDILIFFCSLALVSVHLKKQPLFPLFIGWYQKIKTFTVSGVDILGEESCTFLWVYPPYSSHPLLGHREWSLRYCMPSLNSAQLCWVLSTTYSFSLRQCPEMPGHWVQAPLLSRIVYLLPNLQSPAGCWDPCTVFGGRHEMPSEGAHTGMQTDLTPSEKLISSETKSPVLSE